MAKFRRLSTEELTTFRKEFIDFLVINGITADDWEQLKREEPDKAEFIIDQFSDVIFEGVFRKTQFMTLELPGMVSAVQCLDSKLIMVTARSKGGQITELHKSEKKIASNRSEELFALSVKGFAPSDGTMFKRLTLLTAEISN